MRYYIVDNQGNVWGDFGTKERAKVALDNYNKEDIKKYKLEIKRRWLLWLKKQQKGNLNTIAHI